MHTLCISNKTPSHGSNGCIPYFKQKQADLFRKLFSNHPQERGRSVVKEQSLVFLSVQTETKTCEEEGDEQERKQKERLTTHDAAEEEKKTHYHRS
jgi:hypothetical protein